MELRCKLCNERFQSLNVIQDEAVVEVCRGLAEHSWTAHTAEAKQIATELHAVMISVPWYVVTTGFADISPTERYLTKKLTDFEDAMLKLLGFDPDEDVGIDNNTGNSPTGQPKEPVGSAKENASFGRQNRKVKTNIGTPSPGGPVGIS